MSLQDVPAYLSGPAREILSDQIHQASNLDEVLEARSALRACMQKHPDDVGLVDGAGEMLSLLEDCYRGIAAEEALMTEEERVHTRARAALYRSAQSPWSLADVEAAERGLRLWLCEHPDDEEMRGLYPTLAMYREMYEILAQDGAAEAGAAKRGAVPELAAR